MLGKTSMNSVLVACALLLLSGVFGGRVFAQQKPPFDALEGLDPVMLTQGKEVQGEMNITVTRGQFRYMFANAANKALFEQDPARYEIQLNGASISSAARNAKRGSTRRRKITSKPKAMLNQRSL